MKRWLATVTYRTRDGSKAVPYEFEEFDELGEILEQGPCWSVIIDISIKLHRAILDDPECPMTLEDETEARAQAGMIQ